MFKLDCFKVTSVNVLIKNCMMTNDKFYKVYMLGALRSVILDV